MKIDKIIRIIKTKERFLISTHVHPDPDALCSELAFAGYLKSIGKQVFVINEDQVPHHLKFLPGSASVLRTGDMKKDFDYDAAVVVDCGDLNRIGNVQSILKKGRPIINIDHHITNDFFGNLNLVIADASSTAEILHDLLMRVKCRFTQDIARLLYLGIMTDTGSFRYDNTTYHSHEIVSRLLKNFYIPIGNYYKRLYESIPVNDLATFTKVMSRFSLLNEGKIVCIELRKSLLKKFSLNFDLRDKIFSYLRSIKGVEVIVILTEFKKDLTRVNFRSQGKINVAKIASYFDGGGHAKASGCIVPGGMISARKKVLKVIGKSL